MRSFRFILPTFFLLFLVGASKQAWSVEKQTECKMTFNLKSWSVFYKSGRGSGTITCDNGQRAHVALRAQGGGLTFGKGKIVNGTATFSKVNRISELYGSYASAEAHGGAGKSGTAQALTKGEVSLTLSGTGHGVDIGFDFGRFKITPLR